MAIEAAPPPSFDVWPDPGVTNATNIGSISNDLVAGETLTSSIEWGIANPLVAVSGQILTGSYAESDIELPAVDVSGTVDPPLDLFAVEVSGEILPGLIATSDVALPELEVSGQILTGSYAESDIELPGLEVTATMGAVSDIEIPLAVSGQILPGSVAQGAFDVTQIDIEGIIIGPSAELAGQFDLDPLAITGEILPGSVAEAAFDLPILDASGELLPGSYAEAAFDVLILDFSGSIATTPVIGSAQLVLPAIEVSGVIYPPAAQTQGDARVSAFLAGVESMANVAMVLNTGNNAVSHYANYPFNSMARFAGRYLAAGAGGIYELEGETDNGSPIQAVMTSGHLLGERDHQKRIRQAHIAYRSSGQLELRVKTDDSDWNAYLLDETQGSGIYRSRVKMGRGQRGHYYQFEVRNVAGKAFAIDSLIMEPEAITRRVS